MHPCPLAAIFGSYFVLLSAYNPYCFLIFSLLEVTSEATTEVTSEVPTTEVTAETTQFTTGTSAFNSFGLNKGLQSQYQLNVYLV